MVGSVLVSFIIATLTLCTIGATGPGPKCSQMTNAIEYGADRCIFVMQWFPSSMEEAETACGNLTTSADLQWNLPKFDSESTRKWNAMRKGVNKLMSMEMTTFWMGLVRKNGMWMWLIDGSVLDETTAMWKNGNGQSGSGDCVMAEWDRETKSMKWIESACQNGSTGASILVCESNSSLESGPKTKLKPQKSKSRRRPMANLEAELTSEASSTTGGGKTAQLLHHPNGSPDDVGPWDAYGKWIVLGVGLLLVAVLVIIGTVFIIRRRRRISKRQMMTRRDPPSDSKTDSPGSSVPDDSLSAFFRVSKSEKRSIEEKHEEIKHIDEPHKNNDVLQKAILVDQSNPSGQEKKSNSDSNSQSELSIRLIPTPQ